MSVQNGTCLSRIQQNCKLFSNFHIGHSLIFNQISPRASISSPYQEVVPEHGTDFIVKSSYLDEIFSFVILWSRYSISGGGSSRKGGASCGRLERTVVNIFICPVTCILHQTPWKLYQQILSVGHSKEHRPPLCMAAHRGRCLETGRTIPISDLDLNQTWHHTF